MMKWVHFQCHKYTHSTHTFRVENMSVQWTRTFLKLCACQMIRIEGNDRKKHNERRTMIGSRKRGKGREAQIKRRTLHLMNYVFKSICELIRPHTPFKLCKNVIFWKRFEGNCSKYTHSSLVLFSRLRAPSWTWTWALPFLFFRVVANKSSVRASTIWAMLSLQCSY